MARIAVIGGTGYAGSHIVAEAVSRSHTVVSVARSVPAERVEGATYIEGTLLDVPSLVAELEGVDVVVLAVPARGDMEGNVRSNVAELVAENPAQLVVEALQAYPNNAATAIELEITLAQVVGEDKFKKWWAAAKKLVAKDPRIAVPEAILRSSANPRSTIAEPIFRPWWSGRTMTS